MREKRLNVVFVVRAKLIVPQELVSLGIKENHIVDRAIAPRAAMCAGTLPNNLINDLLLDHNADRGYQ